MNRATILIVAIAASLSASPSVRPRAAGSPVGPAAKPSCDSDNGGITLPDGFCALVVADQVGRARPPAVAANGDIFVALEDGRGAKGGFLALRDTTGDGKADVRETAGPGGGTGIALSKGTLYFSTATTVFRFALPAGRLKPVGEPSVIVKDLPPGGHNARNLALSADGRTLFVNVGSPSNVCQVADRSNESPGKDPCPELATRAGIWRFDAEKQDQTEETGTHYATGIRNAVGMVVAADGQLWSTQHGRDQLFQNWPKLFTVEQSAEKPSEELLRINQGDDFGWPYCYHDLELGHLVLAPEYGGDGKQVGRCAQKKEPALAFPGHWAPDGLLFYTGSQFPASYRGGAFIAFHGSWNRAPLPQAGYRVVFVPFKDGKPVGTYQTFADGFWHETGTGPQHRPVGLAQGPDGSLYVTDDAAGRIWRVIYKGR
jgi:glucose/arabinose dehydrogenase